MTTNSDTPGSRVEVITSVQPDAGGLSLRSSGSANAEASCNFSRTEALRLQLTDLLRRDRRLAGLVDPGLLRSSDIFELALTTNL